MLTCRGLPRNIGRPGRECRNEPREMISSVKTLKTPLAAISRGEIISYVKALKIPLTAISRGEIISSVKALKIPLTAISRGEIISSVKTYSTGAAP